MILDSIIIENFGAYGGRQEANLCPDPERPIILFGGMNGGGKTTLLDAIQLAFYGSKARLSNRGRLSYRDYLRESIHRGADPGEGSGITLRYRRFTDGESHSYELQRHWRLGVKGIEESFRVLRDGLPDQILTEHWDATIANFLPVRLAHLFFFDGEQIKDLAEGDHATDIIGTAVDGLLGIDLLERLDLDLKVFERGIRDERRKEEQENENAQKLRQAEGELIEIDRQLEEIANLEGSKVNEANQLAKQLRQKEERFKAAGGDLYLRQSELEKTKADLEQEKVSTEEALRELVAGPLSLTLVDDLLAQVADRARHETGIKHARVLLEALEERDQCVIDNLKSFENQETIERIAQTLIEDRQQRTGLAHETLILNADDQLPLQIDHLRSTLIPESQYQAQILTKKLAALNERIDRLTDELARVPNRERIAEIQADFECTRDKHKVLCADIEILRERRETLKRQRIIVNERIDRFGLADLEQRHEFDDHKRMLKHSRRVRGTLDQLRMRIINRHVGSIESLMLESFLRLLHKSDLVRELKIDPKNFIPTLIGRDERPLPFDRLSAGERQLLATAMLWGLARASGRPIPTIIDTPLGRLDSSHRRNLVERYFPYASHQVILLSTDEEIVGHYYETIVPHMSRSYLLKHDQKNGFTEITQGYFNEAAS